MFRPALPLTLLSIATVVSATQADDPAPPAAPPGAVATEEGATEAVATEAGATDPTRIEADDAAAHVGEECVVEMVVRAARALADKDICFLNSRQDRRDESTFTAVIFKAGLERFRAVGIENPALHFLDRRIRIRGTVSMHKERPQIVVEDPAQIELVEEPPTPDAKE